MERIGVFFGSRSPEHEISIITGELIIAELKKLGHTVVPIYIDKDSQWSVSEELGSLQAFTGPTGIKQKNYHKVYLDLESSNGKLVFKKKGIGGKEYIVDIAFPAFHGQNGEDGTIQGLFEILNVPYVGCDVACSAITIDKVLTKLLYQRYGIPTTDFTYFDSLEWDSRATELLAEFAEHLAFPVFVKPARLGSSIGIAKAKDKKELELAIEVALRYDNKVLVEKAVEHIMDITCAVMGDATPAPSLIQESMFGEDLFTYEDKYLNEGGAQLGNAAQKIIIPARINSQLTEEIRQLSVDIFKKFGCSGMARIDFLFDKKSEKYYANEINTLPGTLYHHLWKASGLEIGVVLKRLLELAQERHSKKRKLIHSFESSILKQAHSTKLQIQEENRS